MVTRIAAQSYTVPSRVSLMDQKPGHHRPLRGPSKGPSQPAVQPPPAPTVPSSQPQALSERKIDVNSPHASSKLGLAALAGLTTLNALIIGAWIAPSSMASLASVTSLLLSSAYSSLEQISQSALEILGIR